MSLFLNLIVALQILTALVMIGLVLIQHGKGADMGASFGSGASGSLFGATGSGELPIFVPRHSPPSLAYLSGDGWPCPRAWRRLSASASQDVMQQGVMGNLPAGVAGATPPGRLAAGTAAGCRARGAIPSRGSRSPGASKHRGKRVGN